MVVAEIPFWLVHSNSTGGPNGVLGGGGVDVASGIGTNETQDGHMRAQDSLSLLESSGRGKKCAIYSVDVSPCGKKFATSGGDGMVRLWSMSALFSRKRSRYVEDGAYESSDVTDSSDPGNSDDEQHEQSKNGNLGQPAHHEEMIHDLSSFVRRKKGGGKFSPTKVSGSDKDRTAPLSPSRTKANSSSNRLLCTLAAHTGSSVLAVRFSKNGQYLASAGDDAVVCIYAPTSASTGNLTDPNASEHWSRIKLCRGHGLDVVGLAWAPDDSHLVSCSLDSDTPIIVWKLTDLANSDSQRRTHGNVLCNPYKVLGKGIHTSTVKGVTFDPAGTYIASSGDDPAVCIWRAHDDWGLERRIDSGSGIFRKWKEDDAQSLSSQTLFRRLSWSTDGAFICSTNCVLKNRHVASTISREGWSVSTARSAAAGAANLVGHKQPVMVSRHSSNLLDSSKSNPNAGSGSDDGEPEYATLLALGDRHGFVTIWSTRRARPIFKLQCSESRCTVTDLAWGKVKNNIILLVSLLDGHVVALRFAVPGEVGPLLSRKEQARVFQLRYGIDLDDTNGLGKRRLFVGDNSGPGLIENALQLSLEDKIDENKIAADAGNDNLQDPFAGSTTEESLTRMQTTSPLQVKAKQQESLSRGKKRIRPVLMALGTDEFQPQPKRLAFQTEENKGDNMNESKKNSDPLQYAVELANKASSSADAVVPKSQEGAAVQQEAVGDTSEEIVITAPQTQREATLSSAAPVNSSLQHSTKRIHSADLPTFGPAKSDMEVDKPGFVVDCSNSLKVSTGSQSNTIPCTDISISCGGKISWRDQIHGAACSALAASTTLFAVGTSDGSVQLFGTSPALGWECGTAFRSHPPLVFGQPVVSLQLNGKDNKKDSDKELDMLVLIADGNFAVYCVLPELQLRYKGSVMPAMVHMNLGCGGGSSSDLQLPKVSRIHLTETDRLFLLLSTGRSSSSDSTNVSRNSSRQSSIANIGAGGSLQAFVYNVAVELWMRVSDGRFALSDFYTILPKSQQRTTASPHGLLAWSDDAVRMGSAELSLAAGRRSRVHFDAESMYQQAEVDSGNFIATRAHCEDRMACSLVLGSAKEFKHWLSLYVRILARGGHAALLRLLADMLLGGATKRTVQESSESNCKTNEQCLWLSSAPTALKLNVKSILQSIFIPEMSKNRALQRITNELSLEIDSI